MKIAILTHPLLTNYGGILQAYALSEYLRGQGSQVTILNRQTNLPFIKRWIKYFLVAIHHPRYNYPRYKHLSMFVRTYINCSKRLYTSAQMMKHIISNKFDLVVVGSDQVWRADFTKGYGYDYFLDFVPDNVAKASYAASFGLSEWNYTKKETDRIRLLLSRFNAVSVREDVGVELCKKHLQVNAEHVLDPTMLLNAEDYAAVISPRLVEEDYVFVYWLGTKEEKRKALANVNIGSKRIIDISLRGTDTLIPIEDWLSYIKHADYIVTDSFHGCVFSILFQKQFSIWANDSGGNGRLKSLFTMLGIDTAQKHIDYVKITESLRLHRERSCEFIHRNLLCE